MLLTCHQAHDMLQCALFGLVLGFHAGLVLCDLHVYVGFTEIVQPVDRVNGIGCRVVTAAHAHSERLVSDVDDFDELACVTHGRLPFLPPAPPPPLPPPPAAVVSEPK